MYSIHVACFSHFHIVPYGRYIEYFSIMQGDGPLNNVIDLINYLNSKYLFFINETLLENTFSSSSKSF